MSNPPSHVVLFLLVVVDISGLHSTKKVCPTSTAWAAKATDYWKSLYSYLPSQREWEYLSSLRKGIQFKFDNIFLTRGSRKRSFLESDITI